MEISSIYRYKPTYSLATAPLAFRDSFKTDSHAPLPILRFRSFGTHHLFPIIIGTRFLDQ